ncbi:hypothetical protein Sango_1122500 [Sesamum angolense]|uniref:Armadillo-like repeats domain-containing protein n=1 Tax=Sesamum angolense TaxID=2727404 RepID=A0AAE1WUX6_9LAMI|nr:hypothetical protein Sango_1122500 [Sesamum angolense]
MATCTGSLYTCCCTRYSSRNVDNYLFPKYRRRSSQFPLSISFSSLTYSPSRPILARALSNGDKSSSISGKKEQKVEEEEEEEEVEEELPWIQEKALDLVEFTGSVTQAIPGPRVGQSSLPWVLAVPLAYLGITFVMAFVKTVRKFSSPREQRRKLVNKNAMLCKSVDELFEKGAHEVDQSALKGLQQKTSVLKSVFMRYLCIAESYYLFKYLEYLLFSPLSAAKWRNMGVVEDITFGIVIGPVVMDMSGYSEKGFKRKLAVQALFGKVYYLSELPEFCSRDSSLTVKEIFGVADEDAEKLRLHTVSEAGDLDSLEKMVDGSDATDSSDEPSDAS